MINTKNDYFSINETEKKIIQLLADGAIYEDIAQEFNKSVRTIKSHTEKLKIQFNCRTLTQLVVTIVKQPTL